jgi:hypothetical protein
VFQKELIQSHRQLVKTPLLTSPKSILVVRSYFTCGGGVGRTDLRINCSVSQETVAELDVLEKYKGTTRGGCSWKLNVVNRACAFTENETIAHATSRWTLYNSFLPTSGYFSIPKNFCQEN